MGLSSEIDALMLAANQTLALMGDAEEKIRILQEEQVLLEADMHDNKAVAMEIASRLREVAIYAGHLGTEEGNLAMNDGLEALRDLIAERLEQPQRDAVAENVIHLAEHLRAASNADRQPAEDAREGSTLREAVQNGLAGLTPREAKVLRMRYGIGVDTHYTLAEIARHFGGTGARIRQVHNKAMRKLKHPSRSDCLRPFFEQLDVRSIVTPEGRLLMSLFAGNDKYNRLWP
jgi:RNA polymerase sigma factor (sigma-70 family)